MTESILVSLGLLMCNKVFIAGVHSRIRVMLLSVSVVSEIKVLSTDLSESHLVNVSSLMGHSVD